MNRRDFLGLLGKGALVVGAGGLIVPAAKRVWQVPVQLKAKPSRTRIQKAQSFGRNYGMKFDLEYYKNHHFGMGIGEVGKAKYLMENNTYSLMKRMHRELYSGA